MRENDVNVWFGVYVYEMCFSGEQAVCADVADWAGRGGKARAIALEAISIHAENSQLGGFHAVAVADGRAASHALWGQPSYSTY